MEYLNCSAELQKIDRRERQSLSEVSTNSNSCILDGREIYRIENSNASFRITINFYRTVVKMQGKKGTDVCNMCFNFKEQLQFKYLWCNHNRRAVWKKNGNLTKKHDENMSSARQIQVNCTNIFWVQLPCTEWHQYLTQKKYRNHFDFCTPELIEFCRIIEKNSNRCVWISNGRNW